MSFAVIVSYADDRHAAGVLDLLRQDGHETLLFDLSDLPKNATITFDYDRSGNCVARYALKGALYSLDRARSVWWRRPRYPDLEAISDPDAHAFAANEWNEALTGLWRLIGAPWMNPPARDQAAARKAFQLKIAAGLGLRIPRTLITSDPGAAREFCHSQGLGRTVYKSFSATRDVWRETRVFGARELDGLDQLRLAPVIFQEYISGGLDIRATVIGDCVFAAAINVPEGSYQADFRMSLGKSRIEPIELPTAVAQRLRDMLRHFGLVYGAFDLRRTPDGDYVFLEVNTSGEFLFIEQQTGQPITRTIADWLVAPVGCEA